MKTVSFLCRLLGLLLILLVVIVYLPLTLLPMLGYPLHTITSGSMEPAIPVGSLIICARADPAALTAGDVVVYGTSESGTVTHRVVENHISEAELITKGDANESNDLLPVCYDDVQEKVLLHIPQIGTAAAVATEQSGKITAAAVLAAAVLLRVIGSRLRREKPHKTEKEKDTL